MPTVSVVQPVYFAVLSPNTLGEGYEDACASIGLNPIPQGYGLMLAIREDLTRVTMIAQSAQLVRDIADASPDERQFMILGEGRFPIVGPDWVPVPDAAIIGTAGKLVIIGPANYGLGPDRPVHSLTYLDNGVDAGALGYARGDQLDEWRADLAADGWVVDDRLTRPAAEQLTYHRIEEIVIRGSELDAKLRALDPDTVPPDYRPIAAAIAEAVDVLCAIADRDERPDSPASRVVVAALAAALADHDAYPAERRPA